MITFLIWWFIISIPVSLITARLMSINPRDDDT